LPFVTENKRLTKTAAIEYAGKIRVNSIAPATTQTPMVDRFMEKWPEYQKKVNASYPVGRIGNAEGNI
jgi:NAD(P)-dependent dehydrogenase (short-subunit alcohol dehydrogenase family)